MSDHEDYDDNDDNEEIEESSSKRKKEDDEDIWPDDVEKCFQEALKIYPQVGRRKLLENGKLYGRNELIAKFIFAKTGKHRTRKQVSSHIQVLGKKMKKAETGDVTTSKTPSKDLAKDYASSSLSQVPFRSVPSQDPPPYQLGRPVILMKYFSSFFERTDAHYSGMVNRHVYAHLFCESPSEIFLGQLPTIPINHIENQFAGLRNLFDRGTSNHFYLVKMSLNLNSDRSSGLHSLSVKYESSDSLTVKCSTTVYSFGKPVVEKIQVEEPYVESSTNAYYFNHSPMCDYMVQFAEKLRSLNDANKMNKVLDNFSVLQVLVDPRNNTILMATAFLFSIGTSNVLENQILRITRPV